MSFRPGSSAGRPGSRGGMPGAGAGRPPGTATRLATGMAGQKQPVMGGGVALSAQLNVTDRPVTQQGLSGMKTGASRGPQRQVQDKTYFQGLLRSKVNDLQLEIRNLKAEINVLNEDQSSFLTYEKRAENLANELKQLQAEMGDYNTLVDKLTTDENVNDIQMDYEDLKAQNDKIASSLDALFEQRTQREDVAKQLDLELQQEKSMTDTLIADMEPNMRQKYLQMKDLDEHLMKQLENAQQEIDHLAAKKRELEEELSISPVKQEAVRQYEQLSSLEEKRDSLLEEQKARVSPQEEKEKLLKQVKSDNQEIASMERQANEIKERMVMLGDELQQLNMDIEENQGYSESQGDDSNKTENGRRRYTKRQGERNQKYRELKKREETMNEFIDTFEATKKEELEKIAQLEQNTVLTLEHMSRNLGRVGHMPSQQELASMKDDLNFKENEMEKSKYTASGLAGESEKLNQDLQKVEQLESKITTELDMLRENIDRMTEELKIYEDLDMLRSDGEKRKKQLGEDKVTLHRRRDTFKGALSRMSAEYDALKAQLNDNETYVQLGNLERKWQHHEQNNHVMKEFIASKQQECDYGNIAKKLKGVMSEYNSALQNQTSQPSY